MRKVVSLILLLLSGCAAYKPIVTGASGKSYTAPDKCAALVSCLNAGETGCYYDKTILTTSQGNIETDECKEVKK